MCFLHDILIKNWKHILRHAPKIDVLNSINNYVFLNVVRLSNILDFIPSLVLFAAPEMEIVSQVTLCMAANYFATVKLCSYVKCSSHFFSEVSDLKQVYCTL
jgi:hypothetical protein